MEEEARENNLEREVFASNPAMWMEMFGTGAPAMPVDDNGVLFPATPEDLEAMAAEWEAQGWVQEISAKNPASTSANAM